MRWYIALEIVIMKRFVQQYLHYHRHFFSIFSRSPCLQIHDMIMLFLELIDFDMSNRISSLLKILDRLAYWLDASLGFDTRLDWLDRLNRGWIEWIRVHLMRSDPPVIFASNIDRIWVCNVCIKVGEWDDGLLQAYSLKGYANFRT